MGISKIEKPYYLDGTDWTQINTYFTGNHKDWELEEFDDFKSKVKDYLRIEQRNRCCYCKKILHYDKKEVDIEHIIPKSRRPRFTFLNYNLALSCPACNTTKSTHLPLVTATRKTFPYKSADYKVVHPYFDYYFQEIEIIKDVFIKSKGAKGDWTIEKCGLDTMEKAKDKIMDLMMTRQLKKDDIHNLLIQLTLKVANPNILNVILGIIDDIKNRVFIIH